MSGRIRRKLRSAGQTLAASSPTLFCALCGRVIPLSQQDAHHLIPKSKGGRLTILLHRICHRQIHAQLSENQLAQQYHSIATLLTHPGIAHFVAWIKTKPDGFYQRTVKSQALRRK